MFKKFLLLLLFFVFTNCSAPGTAFLGPVFTGATTKSAARATVSYGSNHIMKKIGNQHKNPKTKDLFN
tara:strand:+ start:120 stop:323 length:204 start_codon:yes stop_codon:yes gene_type:complete